MAKAIISGIAPFFVVKNVPLALAFYRDRLGFDIVFQGPGRFFVVVIFQKQVMAQRYFDTQ